VVAHFHYVLIGGAVFPLMGALYYWFPKFTGRMLSESLGRVHFWLFFIGFNVTFFPMHLLGLMGMPRRVYTYPGSLGWDLPNLIASLGSWVIAASVVVFLFNVLYAVRQGRPAGDNPWGAPDLEWSTRSPPPPYNFEHTPAVRSNEPLWPLDGTLSVVRGLSNRYREALLTTSTDAVPVTRWAMPDPSIWPLWSAMALTLLFVWSIFSPWGVVWGLIPLGITLTTWFWPKRSDPSLGGGQ
jgi:cytochrome c oxidase subunit I+III